jgi:hypothetical protein
MFWALSRSSAHDVTAQGRYSGGGSGGGGEALLICGGAGAPSVAAAARTMNGASS